MKARVAAVTGGTGFLGRHVVRALAAVGWRVRILARRDPVDPLWPDDRSDVELGDLHDVDSLRRLCRGAEAVVHVAGLVKARSPAAFDAVNVVGAERMAQAARAVAPDAAFVLVSSLAARSPHLSDYARSKREGEAAVERALGRPARVLRPGAVYGPGDRETLALFRAAAASPVLPVLRPDARITLIHVEDAARGVAAAAAGPGFDRPLALCDDRPDGYGLREIMTAAAEVVGARPRLGAAPSGVLRALGIAGDLARTLGATPMLTSGKVREVLHRDWSVAPEDRWAGEPYACVGLMDGFRHTVAWYRGVGWL